MSDRWVCKRCFADNDASSSACQRCGLIRGSESTPADQGGWAQAAGSMHERDRPAWRRWLRYWWIPALAVVLLVGYASSARRDEQGALEAAGTVTVDQLRAGDCFDTGEEVEIADVDGVPCSEPHEYQVFAVDRYEADTYPSDAQADEVFASVCEARFADFVGEPYETSALYATMITPSEESWADGDRTFICILYDPENAELTESMEGANR